MKSDMLKDKVIVVTGAGGGIGRDIALMLGQYGAKVVVNDIGAALDGAGGSDDPAKAVVKEIETFGGQAVANIDSVSEAESAAKIIETAIKAYGRIDGVINNAGILRDRIFHRMTEQEWDAVLKVHLYGAFYMSKAVAPYFKEQKSGSYLHMTSTSGLIGNMGQANYSAAKLGITALSKSIALDMELFGVRSNCIAPFAWSRMVSSIPADSAAGEAELELIKQMTPAKIAPLAAFLMSDEAKEVSGQVFAVRNNEIFLMSQPRPIRSVHRSEGWTPESIADHAIPTLKSSFFDLDKSGDVFTWDPV